MAETIEPRCLSLEKGERCSIKPLNKQLGLLDVFAICSGAMIRSGLFVLPGIATAKYGTAVVVAYLLSDRLLSENE